MRKKSDIRGIGNFRIRGVVVDNIDGDFIRMGQAPERLDIDDVNAKDIGGSFLVVGDGDYTEAQIKIFRTELRKMSAKIDDVGDFLLGQAIKSAAKSSSLDNFRSRLGKYVHAPALAANLVTIWTWISSLLPK
jgi:hypothetical protein